MWIGSKQSLDNRLQTVSGVLRWIPYLIAYFHNQSPVLGGALVTGRLFCKKNNPLSAERKPITHPCCILPTSRIAPKRNLPRHKQRQSIYRVAVKDQTQLGHTPKLSYRSDFQVIILYVKTRRAARLTHWQNSLFLSRPNSICSALFALATKRPAHTQRAIPLPRQRKNTTKANERERERKRIR